MKGKRDSLRVWLEKNLNGNKIRGLEWRDPKKKIFRIRWKHASKHGWSSELDGCVFREWAIYSGKFKPGEKAQEEPKVWKANFRCALNALPDIQEIVEERETRGNEAQKMFHMKPHVSKHSKRSRGSSFRYRDTSSYEVSSCYSKHVHDQNMLPLQSVWTHGSSSVGPWSENPPPLLLRKDRDCYLTSERESGAFPGHTRTIKENETVMPEHKIIELIDSWSHELKEKHETRFPGSMQISKSNFLKNPVEACYQDPRYHVQSLCVGQTPHYYSTPVPSQSEPSQSCFASYASRI